MIKGLKTWAYKSQFSFKPLLSKRNNSTFLWLFPLYWALSILIWFRLQITFFLKSCCVLFDRPWTYINLKNEAIKTYNTKRKLFTTLCILFLLIFNGDSSSHMAINLFLNSLFFMLLWKDIYAGFACTCFNYYKIHMLSKYFTESWKMSISCNYNSIKIWNISIFWMFAHVFSQTALRLLILSKQWCNFWLVIRDVLCSLM